MDANLLEDWSAALEAALASEEETDLEPLWNQLDAAIAQAPGDPGLRRLRIRFASAIHQPATWHQDLLALRAIDPADRENWLALALLQHRWAFLLADDDEGDEGDESDGDAASEGAADTAVLVSVRTPDPEGEEADSRQAQLEREARGWLAQMLREHRADAAFAARVFARWAEAGIYAPWLRLTLALEAAAAHPGDAALLRVLGEAWADLANQAPEQLDLENAPPPMGFLFDVGGALWDPFLQERALAVLDTLPPDLDTLACRARLLEARCDFPAAARAYAQAAEAAGRAAAEAADLAMRDAVASQQEELQERAGLCAAGRQAVAAAMIDGLADAVAQFGQPLPLPDDASEARRAFASEWAASQQGAAQELQAGLDAMRAARPADGPDPEQLDQMRAQARQIAANIVRGITLSPVHLEPLAPAGFEQDWETALQPARSALAALQWRDLGWVQWPAYRDLLGHQAVSSVWCDAGGHTIALVSAVGTMALVDLETELEDGHMVVTALSRGRNFLTGGPGVDTLFIEPALAMEDAVALHAARCAAARGTRPGVGTLRCTDLAAVEAAQERARKRKTAFRIAQGLTESESLGVPHDFPEVFAPLLRQAVFDAFQPLRIR